MTESMPEWCQEELVRIASSSPTREVCGFIMQDWFVLMVDNVSGNDLQFRMDPDQQLHVQMEHGADILGVYHSHPGGLQRPSLTDIAMAPIGLRYWIIADGEVSEWSFKDGYASLVEADSENVA